MLQLFKIIIDELGAARLRGKKGEFGYYGYYLLVA